MDLTVDNERFNNFLFTVKLRRLKLLLAAELIVIDYHNHIRIFYFADRFLYIIENNITLYYK